MADELKEHRIPMSGQVLMPTGVAALVRIPIPGTNLCIELDPRGWVPRGGSTSTLFFQDIKGKKHLRLDFGFNVKTNSVNYHWNANTSTGHFGFGDHQVAEPAGKYVYQAARYFRWGGRLIGIAGVTLDVVSIVEADRPMRRATEVVSAWALARVGCLAAGEYGAGVGVAGGPTASRRAASAAASSAAAPAIGLVRRWLRRASMSTTGRLKPSLRACRVPRAAEFDVNDFMKEVGTPRW